MLALAILIVASALSLYALSRTFRFQSTQKSDALLKRKLVSAR